MQIFTFTCLSSGKVIEIAAINKEAALYKKLHGEKTIIH